MKRFFTLSILCLFVLTACGYSTRSLLPARLDSIYIEPFENDIDYTNEQKRTLYLPLLETQVQENLIDRFLFDGNLRIAKTEDAALILRGKLLDYRRDDLRLDDNEDVQEYRISIIVSLEMFDVANDEVLWSETAFAGTADYFLSGPHATSEDSAVDEALEDLARRVVARTVENW